eukprot:gene5458-975_t
MTTLCWLPVFPTSCEVSLKDSGLPYRSAFVEPSQCGLPVFVATADVLLSAAAAPKQTQLTVFVVYCFTILAIPGIHLFGHILVDDEGLLAVACDTLDNCILSMFQIMTGDAWHRPMHSAMEDGMQYVSPVYYSGLFVVARLVLLSYFTAIVLHGFELSDKEKARQSEQQYQEYNQCWDHPKQKWRYLILAAYRRCMEKEEKARQCKEKEGKKGQTIKDDNDPEPGLRRADTGKLIQQASSAGVPVQLTGQEETWGLNRTKGFLRDAFEETRSTLEMEAQSNQIRRPGGKHDPRDKQDRCSATNSQAAAYRRRSTILEAFTLQDIGTLNDKSCFCLTKSNPLRRACRAIMNSTPFVYTILLCIVASAIILALDPPDEAGDCVVEDQHSAVYEFITRCSTRWVMFYLDVFFICIFSLEAVVKIVGLGFWNPGKVSTCYIKDKWNVFDMFLLIMLYVSFITRGVPYMRWTRVFRTVRPLRLAHHNKHTNVIFTALLDSLFDIGNIFLGLVFCYWVFGLLGVQLFKGDFDFCNDTCIDQLPWPQRRDECVGDYFRPIEDIQLGQGLVPALDLSSPDTPSGLLMPRKWITPPATFNNLALALLTLFEVTSLSEWSVPATRAERLNGPFANVFFVFVIVFMAFWVMNVFIGVITNSIDTRRGVAILTDQQRYWRDLSNYISKLKPLVNGNPQDIAQHTRRAAETAQHTLWFRLRVALYSVVRSRWFRWFILVTIFALILAEMTVHAGDDEPGKEWLLLLQQGIAAVVFTIFFLEMLLKLVAYTPRVYFSNRWHWYDAFVAVGGIVAVLVDVVAISLQISLDSHQEIGIEYPWLTNVAIFTRLMRIFGIARLLNKIPRLKKLTNLLSASLVPIICVYIILLLLVFIFALLGVQTFSSVRYGRYLNKYSNFRDFGEAYQTLMQVMTFDAWNGIMHDLAVSAPVCTRVGTEATLVDGQVLQDPDLARYIAEGSTVTTEDVHFDDCGTPWTYVYFILFLFLVTYIFFNLVVSIVLDGFHEAYSTELTTATICRTDLEHFLEYWVKYDRKGKGFVHRHELMEAVLYEWDRAAVSRGKLIPRTQRHTDAAAVHAREVQRARTRDKAARAELLRERDKGKAQDADDAESCPDADTTGPAHVQEKTFGDVLLNSKTSMDVPPVAETVGPGLESKLACPSHFYYNLNECLTILCRHIVKGSALTLREQKARKRIRRWARCHWAATKIQLAFVLLRKENRRLKMKTDLLIKARTGAKARTAPKPTDDDKVQTHSTNSVSFDRDAHEAWAGGRKAEVVALACRLRKLYTAGADGTVREWDLDTHTLIRSFGLASRSRSACMVMSVVGRFLIVCHKDSSMRIWDVEQGLLLSSVYAHGRGKLVLHVDGTADPDVLWTCSTDNTIRQWNTVVGTHVGTFYGHHSQVWWALYVPSWPTDDGPDAHLPRLLTAGADSTVKVWDPAAIGTKGALCHTIETKPEKIQCLAHLDGALYAGSTQGAVHVYDPATRTKLTTVTVCEVSGINSALSFGDAVYFVCQDAGHITTITGKKGNYTVRNKTYLEKPAAIVVFEGKLLTALENHVDVRPVPK